MSWLFSQALVEEFSPAQNVGEGSFAQLNVMPTQHKFWRKDKTMDHSRLSQFGLTCALLTEDRGEELLTAFLAASRARTSASPVMAKDSKERDHQCGFSLRGSLARYSQQELRWKTAQCSLLGDSEEFLETWPRWGTTVGGELYLLPQPALPICGNGSGFWPTPNACEASNDMSLQCSGDGRKKPNKLGWAVASSMVPTPVASMAKGSSLNALTRKNGRDRTRDRLDHFIYAHHGGQLNPEWVEWLMGWPIGWTDLKPLETDKSHTV